MPSSFDLALITLSPLRVPLVALTPASGIAQRIRLDPTNLPRLTDIYDPGNNSPDVTLASVDDRNAAPIAKGSCGAYPVYLVDLASGAPTLTAFSDRAGLGSRWACNSWLCALVARTFSAQPPGERRRVPAGTAPSRVGKEGEKVRAQ